MDYNDCVIGELIPEYVEYMVIREVSFDENGDTLKINQLSDDEITLNIYDKFNTKLGQGKSIFYNNRLKKTIVIDTVDNKIRQPIFLSTIAIII